MATGRLVSIHVIPVAGGEPQARSAARALPGGGLEGDRHARVPPRAGWLRELTLISAEALEHLEKVGLPLAPGASRRQLVTRGVDLAALVGRRFRVGAVLLAGTKPCHPCDHLEALTRPGVRAALEGQGGLCARIVEGGLLRVGDDVAPLGEPA
jgi:MOSC domain-containing protein YiiM